MKLHAIKRVWWRWHGEQPLVTTFWPQDYPRGGVQDVNGSRYVITRYVRSTHDGRFFEVWGRQCDQ